MSLVNRRHDDLETGDLPTVVADYSRDMISIQTAEGVYRYANPAFTDSLGWKPSELVGRNAYEFFHPDDVSRILRDHSSSMCGSNVSIVTYRMRTKEGPYKWVETKTSTLRKKDGTIRALFSCTRDLEEDVDPSLHLRFALLCSESKAERDSMTNLWNKEATKELTQYRLNIAKHRQRATSVAILDMDHFKRINDTFGHLAGDQAIEYVAAVLRSALRVEDLIGRYGGEEFLVVLPNTEYNEAHVVMQRIRRHFETITGPNNVIITVSIGYVTDLESRHSAESLIDVADQCLYEAKEAGRNRVVGRVLG